MSEEKARYKYKKSELLTDYENVRVREMLGRGCQGMATSVVQLFMTHPPQHIEWVKKYAGIMCLVKDIPKRSYFLRLFCPVANTKLWELMLFKKMLYAVPRPFIHVIEGEVGLVAVNYASEYEAAQTYDIIADKLGLEKIEWNHAADATLPAQAGTSKTREETDTKMNPGRSAAEDEDEDEDDLGVTVHDSLFVMKSKNSALQSDSIAIMKTKVRLEEDGTKDGKGKSPEGNKSKGKVRHSSIDTKTPQPDLQGPPFPEQYVVAGGNDVTATMMEAAEDQAMGEFNMEDAVQLSGEVN